MRVPYSWLTEYVEGAPSAREAEELLTMSGTKVEAVHEFGVPGAGGSSNGDGPTAGYRVGRVLSFEQHPNADRLRLCRVDVGEGEPRQIICGASNFAEGDTVAVVLPGSTLPGGQKIGSAKLRGVESHGMMLSERELEISTDHAGIMVLPEDWQPGEPLASRLPLGDTVLELEITPNRPDCLGVFGVARELAAVAKLPLTGALHGDAEATGDGTVEDHVQVEVQAPDLCPRYMARAFVDVQVGPSPHWLRARLAAAGMRAINNVVDVTNYVMLLTGQPLHAFDADRLRGGRIVVRRAGDSERVTTLDDVERTLDSSVLSIADAEQTAVIAGVMGAADVEVGEHTTRLVLESASFHGPTIQRTSMRLGLRSESSARFEKGLDPWLPEVALRIASRLFVELCGARMVPGTIDARAEAGLPDPPVVHLELEHPGRVLGVQVPADEVREILGRLGYGCTEAEGAAASADGGALQVEVPHWRMFDTTRPIDLVEEVGRVFGLDKVPATMPARRTASGGGLSREQRLQRQLEDTAVGLGFSEAVTYSLLPTGMNQRMGTPAREVLRLANPMTAEHAELRGSMVSSLLDVARHNRALGTADVAIFEVGRTYARVRAGETGADGLARFARERRVLALLATGALHGGRFDAAPIPADLPALAGIVEALVAGAGIELELRPAAEVPMFLHPGQAAEVLVRAPGASDGHVAGWVGTVHPGLAAEYDIAADVVAAQLDIDVLADARPDVLTYRAVGTFPASVQDIAVVLPQHTLAADVVGAAVEQGGDLLESVEVFDRYEGEHVEEGHYSLALRLTVRAPDRTLTDAEVNDLRTGVVSVLEERFGARLRG